MNGPGGSGPPAACAAAATAMAPATASGWVCVTVAESEELGSERIAKGEPKKGLPGALKTVTGHLPLIFAERRPARRLVRAVAGHRKGALPHPRGWQASPCAPRVTGGPVSGADRASATFATTQNSAACPSLISP